MKIKHIFWTSVLCIYLSIMATIFFINLPTWCANPSGNGNWMILHLCTK